MKLNLVRRYLYPDPKEPSGKVEEEPKKETKPEEDNVSLAKALKETRENSVSKEEYERLKAENKRLVSEIINGEGGSGNGQATPPQEADIEALKNKLYGPKCSELTNLEFWKLTLELRDAVIKKDGVDPFLPHGANIKPTDNDVERANAVAQVVSECIEEADGDSGVFTALLQSKINNDSQALTAHLKKIGAI